MDEAAPVVTLRPDDARVEWRGAVEVEHTPQWSRAWRLPAGALSRYGVDGLRERALMPAGVRLVFRTTSATVGVQLDDGWDGYGDGLPVELVVDRSAVGSTRPDAAGRVTFAGLGAEPKEVQLWLPQFGEVRVRALEVDRDSRVEAPAPDARSRLVAYGSSITHGRTAPTPRSTWPALLADALDLHLTSLGFGSECHLDPLVARTVAALPADVVVLCLGINVYTGASLTQRTLPPAVAGFVDLVREGHPAVPVHLVTPIASPAREDVPNAAGLTLAEVRRIVAAAGRRLQQAGDEHLHVVDGLCVLGPEEAHHLPDGLHPDAAGYELMAGRLSRQVRATLRHDGGR